MKIIKEEYKELTLPKKEHQFEPFDKVLVRDSEKGVWKVSLFSHYYKENNPYYTIESYYKARKNKVNNPIKVYWLIGIKIK